VNADVDEGLALDREEPFFGTLCPPRFAFSNSCLVCSLRVEIREVVSEGCEAQDGWSGS
jgi:hypothetical protein